MTTDSQKEKIAKALVNRGIEPTDQVVEEIAKRGGTTAAINEYLKEQTPTPQPEEQTGIPIQNPNGGNQMIQGMVEEIAEANSDELADAIQALTIMKAIGKVQSGHTGDLTKGAIDSLKKGFGGIFSQVSTSVGRQNQSVENGRLPSLLNTEAPKLLTGK